MGLKQHVTQPTHEGGHTLDLVITREYDDIIKSNIVIDRYLSDHAAVLCQLNSAKPKVKEIAYRKLKSINMQAFHGDLVESELCVDKFTELEELTICYNTTLTSLLDKYAPVKTKFIVDRKRVPWFSSTIGEAIRVRRKAERQWRVTKSSKDLATFKSKKNYVTFLMNQERCEYYSNHIQENCINQRQLFKVTKSLLCESKDVSFPQGDPNQLANDFGEYFIQKIENINNSLEALSTPLLVPTGDVEAHDRVDVLFANFRTLSEEEVRSLIQKSAQKSCGLDPIPTSLLLQQLDVLLPVITQMINLSFETGHFASTWKEALLLPLLKNSGLDIAFKNFRPISNLHYVSKLSERAAAEQLVEHMSVNNMHSLLQSAYKKNHSTETALLKVKNDILMSMNCQHVTLLVLLDLSAAFDTIHHKKLIDRLRTDLGIGANALAWFQSYLTERCQRVSVNGGHSRKFDLNQGVPQGSCLGPILFTVYTRRLFEIVEEHLPQVHCYADDTQLYLSFKPDVSSNADAAVTSLSNCIKAIRKWMISDNLMINDSKTEFLLIGTKHQLSKVDIDHIVVGTSEIRPVPVVRNLGAWMDTNLTMSNHISKMCSSAFYHLHNIKRIRKYLPLDATKSLVHAFITCRIDYCNSLLYGLPDCQVHKLQRVLNASARLIYNTPRYCHITPLLRELHWLPIRFRINFKVLLITYKAIHGLAPEYLSDLLHIKRSQYNLRSTNSLLLSYPSIRTKSTLGDRAFAVGAPKLWNSLPEELRQLNSVDTFKKQLKTYFFKLAFT